MRILGGGGGGEGRRRKEVDENKVCDKDWVYPGQPNKLVHVKDNHIDCKFPTPEPTLPADVHGWHLTDSQLLTGANQSMAHLALIKPTGKHAPCAHCSRHCASWSSPLIN